ncbi:insulinase family protein [Candidatus Sumerlaeota bacterium]|nr:insulinase family protein [Candidatus Sumerlaeota bacterium]
MSERQVQCDRLSSGLTVLRIDRPGWPVVTADVWVATGSADESPDQAGISHFLEHMMFKGTEHRGPGELDRIVEGVGGHWNAGTSKDFTHYYLTLPSEHRSLALDALSDAVLRSVIDPEQVERERQVIVEEWRRAEDNPAHLLHMRLYETAHAGGSYRWPVIGSRETIESITRDQIAAYHRGRYRPETMALILAGPVGDNGILGEIGELFTWRESGGEGDSHMEAPVWSPGGMRVVMREVSEVYLAVSWPAPEAADLRAMLALDVGQYVLGVGRASRLYQRLHEEERLVTTIHCSYPAHRRGGMFTVLATCETERAEAAREAIIREVCALGSERPTAPEAARARRLLCSHHTFGRETTSGHTSSVGYHHTLTGDPTFDDRYAEQIGKITAPAVAKAAAQWLSPADAVTTAVWPAEHACPWNGGVPQ